MRLRAVVTKPEAARGRVPAILYVQWLSCDSIAIPPQPKDGWELMLQRLVRDSGALVWRTEKRGVGGSDGRCEALDYETELADHRAALDALRRRADVDPERIVIFGASMGATMAPLLAQGDERLAGVVVWGGGARTWAERTLAFERNRLEFGDTPAERRAGEITARFRLIEDFLVEGRSPAELSARDPDLARAWSSMAGTDATTMYGRPFAYHHQAQRRDWAAAWAAVRAPVLVLLGENDWFEDAGSAALIGEIVNRTGAKGATVAIVPGLDHHFIRYPDRRAAFRGRGGKADPGPATDRLFAWLRERFRSCSTRPSCDKLGQSHLGE
ncbi:MAG TPA: alpha/beta fold hydrolase [Caulobacteraceae bacterium]|jgi:dienelactone hydrolase